MQKKGEAEVVDSQRGVNLHNGAARKPIVVWCNHGVTDGANDFVQRYRWDTDQGKWIPSDLTREGHTFIGPSGKRAPDDLGGLLDGVPDRQHYTARCRFCREHVSMRENGAQIALTRLSSLGLSDVPLAVLRHAYVEVPKVLR